MQKSTKALPSLNHRSSVDEEEASYPGRLHTIQRKLKMSSTTLIKANTSTSYDTFYKKTRMPESQILKQIDTKLEMHKKDIDQRNDMIFHIEKGFESVKLELQREKQINEEKTKQLVELQASYHAVQLKLKQQSETSRQSDRDRDKISQLELTIKQYIQKEQDFQKKIDELTLQLQTQQQDSNNKQDLESKLRDIQLLKDAMRKQEEKIRKLDQEIADLQKTLKLELDEKQSLRKQLDILQNDNNQKYHTQNKEIAQYLGQIKQLETERISLMDSIKKQKEQLDLNKSAQDQLQQLKTQLNEFKSSKEKEIQSLIKQNDVSEKQTINLTTQNTDLQRQIDDLKKNIREKIQQNEVILTQKSEAEKLNQVAQEEINKLLKLIEQLKIPQPEKKLNLKGIQESLQQLENTEREMQKNLTCQYCNKFIKQPVTIIPCGHSYCFDCKKGYAKECSKCGPKLKVEAMYRNELLDDIIEMVRLIQGGIQSLKQIK
ncbi:hypothetical protein pb186bvf_009752 [Paramecium bursaria]